MRLIQVKSGHLRMGRFCTELWAGEPQPSSLLRAISQIVALRVLWTWTLLAFRARCLGAHLSGAGPRSWAEWRGVYTWLPGKKLQVLHCSGGWGLGWDGIPASPSGFNVGLSSFAGWLGAAQTDFSFFFSRGNSSICSCPGSSNMAILNWNLRGHSLTYMHPCIHSYALKPSRNLLLRIF